MNIKTIFLLILIGISYSYCYAETHYMTVTQDSYSIEVPVSWLRIPQTYLDAFAVRIKGTIAEGYANYNCGFQKYPMRNGIISPPAIFIRVNTDCKLAHDLTYLLNKSSAKQTTYTYQKAAKTAVDLLAELGITDAFATNIHFDKNRQMIRFNTSIDSAQVKFKSLTSIYIHNDKVYHVICMTLSNIYADDSETFIKISNSFRNLEKRQ